MTSWFGVGSALGALYNEKPEAYETLKNALKTDAFLRYVFTNVDTSLAASDKNIMKMYIDLVQDEQVKGYFETHFMDELERTKKHLMEILGKGIEERRENHYYSNQLRASLMEIIHKKQVSLLKTWRQMKADNASEAEINSTQIHLMLTINAIASAMRNTG
jgi:phosphoenolpyruvate carboxylase